MTRVHNIVEVVPAELQVEAKELVLGGQSKYQST